MNEDGLKRTKNDLEICKEKINKYGEKLQEIETRIEKHNFEDQPALQRFVEVLIERNVQRLEENYKRMIIFYDRMSGYLSKKIIIYALIIIFQLYQNLYQN